MKMTEMKVGDLLKIVSALSDLKETGQRVDHGLAIAIVDRGWVFVGQCVIVDGWLTIDDCRCIRHWGTTNGIGELATKGPGENTKLEPMPQTKIPERAIIGIVKCTESKWTHA